MIGKLAFDEMHCPKCWETARADFVDNGVGMQQSNPFYCDACGCIEEPETFEYFRPLGPDEIPF